LGKGRKRARYGIYEIILKLKFCLAERAENIRLKYITEYIFFLQTVISYPENRGGKGLKTG